MPCPRDLSLSSPEAPSPWEKDAVRWAKECEALGAGVILPTSMDEDGPRPTHGLIHLQPVQEGFYRPSSVDRARYVKI
jgi:cyclase